MDTAATPETGDAASHTESMTSAAITEADLRYRISTLADDAFAGRAPATPGGIAANQWIAAEMARVGLAPGSQGFYFPPDPLPPVSPTPEPPSFKIAV